MKQCYACAMPLVGEEAGKARGDYCQYCSDEKGNLKPKEEAVHGIAQWLKSWSPPASEEEFLRRAKCYMDAMPAWQA